MFHISISLAEPFALFQVAGLFSTDYVPGPNRLLCYSQSLVQTGVVAIP
jgi:hypothetical protein